MNRRTLIIITGVFILGLVLAFAFYPLFWIIMPLLPASILFYLAVLFSKSKWVSVIISLACIFVFFSIVESYLQIDNPNPPTVRSASPESRYILGGVTTHVDGYNRISDSILGYYFKPMALQTAIKTMYEDIVVFDVLYSWDDKGRRLTPNNLATAGNLVILFGCSFTFGLGLEDRETFAWQLAELLGAGFQVLNYGYSGYGSHHMLALLEGDRLDYLKGKYENVYAFFLTFPSTEQRSAGRTYWAHTGPEYLLNSDGTVSYNGQLNVPDSKFEGKLGQSRFLKEIAKLLNAYINRGSMLDLHAAIILKSAAILNEKFNGNLVTVLYPDYEVLEERLATRNMEMIDLSAYFDDFELNKEKYTIKYDGHPNVEGAKVIAKALYEYIENNKE